MVLRKISKVLMALVMACSTLCWADCHTLDLSVMIAKDFMVVGAKGCFSPNIFYTTLSDRYGKRYVTLHRESADDPGHIMWALYFEKNGVLDHVIVDRKGKMYKAVGSGEGGKNPPPKKNFKYRGKDGVIAPLFYLALGGAVGGMVYKAVNTMDSMLGYKNERYQNFGTAAARLDDVAGFVPARLSGLLLVAAAGLTGMDAAGAWRIFCRDRYAHKSPNSAQSESAVAGALGVQLAGDAVYGGVVVHKPTIGESCREIEAEDIPRACRLMYVAFGLGLSAVTVILILCLWRSGGL